MICRTCHTNTARVRIVHGKEYCSLCGGFSEANGNRIDGILSRQRIRADATKFEGDTINPWMYDTSSKKYEPNPDFIKLHSHNAMNFYQPKDLKNYPKLADSLYTRVSDIPESSALGDYEPAINETINSL